MTTYSDDLKTLLGTDLRALWICGEASGNLTDDTGNGWTMTTFGAASMTYRAAGPTINGESHYAIQFPGNGSTRGVSATTFPGASVTTGRTYGVWVYLPGTAAAWEVPFCRIATGESEFSFFLAATTAYPWMSAYQSDGASYVAEAVDSINLNGGTWHLLLGWWNPADHDVSIQVNDRAVVTAAGTTDIHSDSTAALSLGATSTGGSFIRSGARVALAFVVDRLLTSDERAAIYSGEFTTPQIILPDADVQTTGWTATPLWSKLSDDDDATYITATAS